MGKMTLEEIHEEIKQLSPEDRHHLIDQLIAEEKPIEKSWIDEARNRWREIEAGKVKTIPGEEVLAQARKILSEKV